MPPSNCPRRCPLSLIHENVQDCTQCNRFMPSTKSCTQSINKCKGNQFMPSKQCPVRATKQPYTTATHASTYSKTTSTPTSSLPWNTSTQPTGITTTPAPTSYITSTVQPTAPVTTPALTSGNSPDGNSSSTPSESSTGTQGGNTGPVTTPALTSSSVPGGNSSGSSSETSAGTQGGKNPSTMPTALPTPTTQISAATTISPTPPPSPSESIVVPPLSTLPSPTSKLPPLTSKEVSPSTTLPSPTPTSILYPPVTETPLDEGNDSNGQNQAQRRSLPPRVTPSISTPSEDAESSSTRRISGGAIAGIVVGCTALAGIVGAGIMWKKKRNEETYREMLLHDHTTGSGQYLAML